MDQYDGYISRSLPALKHWSSSSASAVRFIFVHKFLSLWAPMTQHNNLVMLGHTAALSDWEEEDLSVY